MQARQTMSSSMRTGRRPTAFPSAFRSTVRRGPPGSATAPARSTSAGAISKRPPRRGSTNGMPPTTKSRRPRSRPAGSSGSVSATTCGRATPTSRCASPIGASRHRNYSTRRARLRTALASAASRCGATRRVRAGTFRPRPARSCWAGGKPHGSGSPVSSRRAAVASLPSRWKSRAIEEAVHALARVPGLTIERSSGYDV